MERPILFILMLKICELNIQINTNTHTLQEGTKQ